MAVFLKPAAETITGAGFPAQGYDVTPAEPLSFGEGNVSAPDLDPSNVYAAAVLEAQERLRRQQAAEQARAHNLVVQSIANTLANEEILGPTPPVELRSGQPFRTSDLGLYEEARAAISARNRVAYDAIQVRTLKPKRHPEEMPNWYIGQAGNLVESAAALHKYSARNAARYLDDYRLNGLTRAVAQTWYETVQASRGMPSDSEAIRAMMFRQTINVMQAAADSYANERLRKMQGILVGGSVADFLEPGAARRRQPAPIQTFERPSAPATELVARPTLSESTRDKFMGYVAAGRRLIDQARTQIKVLAERAQRATHPATTAVPAEPPRARTARPGPHQHYVRAPMPAHVRPRTLTAAPQRRGVEQ